MSAELMGFAGPYRILRPLGKGVTGEVYLAEQRSPVARRVALKILNESLLTGKSHDRFLGERQLLARMNHHHIAKIFDAGTLENGRPYTVLEYVPGEPLVPFCDANRFTIRQRLNLFLEVCQAVQHAHERGVIHLNLKSENILIGKDGDRFFPKIIDFGMARQIDRNSLRESYSSLGARFLGTLACLSPEQLTGAGTQLDTRTDIYALGALLYRLLAGRYPFEQDPLFSSYLVQVTHQTPVPPTAVLKASRSRGEMAARCKTKPRKLVKAIKGELDEIVLKAIALNPSGRYSSIGELVRDLQRHLRNLPLVGIQTPTLGRVKKFAKRNGWLTVAIVMLPLFLFAGLVGTRWGIQRASLARVTAEQAEVRARSEEDRSRAMTSFLQEMLVVGEGGTTGDLKMVDLLNRMAERLNHRFPEQPILEADLRVTIGKTFIALGHFLAARPHLEQAVRLLERDLGPDHPRTLEAIFNLVEALGYWGFAQDAEKLARDLLPRAMKTLGPGHRITLVTRYNIGVLLEDLGQIQKAELQLISVLNAFRQYRTEDDPDLAACMMMLARIWRIQGRLDEAEQLLREALRRLTAIFGESHPVTTVAIYDLGQLYIALGKLEEAEVLQLRELQISTKLMGEDHPDVLTSMQGLAKTLFLQGRLQEAEAYCRKGLEKRLAVQGKEYDFVPHHMNDLGEILLAKGELEEAGAVFGEVVHLAEKLFPKDHLDLARFNRNLARYYLLTGRGDEAKRLLTRCYEIHLEKLGAEHSETAALRQDLKQLGVQADVAVDLEKDFSRNTADSAPPKP